jgi:ribosomal protein S19E (S16A)
MTKIYGGLKHRGPRPSRFKLGSSSIARDIVKQLERIGIVEKDPKGYIIQFFLSLSLSLMHCFD